MSNDILENLLEISKRRIANTETHFLREMYADIEWKSRLILLKGCRGVGKTYMMLQHLKSSGAASVYLSLDNIYFLSIHCPKRLMHCTKKDIVFLDWTRYTNIQIGPSKLKTCMTIIRISGSSSPRHQH